MSQYVESMLPSMGLALDATGNIVPVPEPGAAVAKSAATTTPTATTTPAKATTTQADVPEPAVTGQTADDPEAAAKKKTLLGA